MVVLAAGVMHAAWNAIAKSVHDRLVTFGLIGGVSALGGGTTLLFTGIPAERAVELAALSAGIHFAYIAALMRSYRLGAFNQTYPIARGTSPLLVVFGAAIFAHEHVGGVALLGIAVLAGGLMSLALSSGRLSRADWPAVLAAMGTGVTIAAYTLVDGLGARGSHDPFAYAAMLFAFEGPVTFATALLLRGRAMWASPRAVGAGLVAGAVSVLAYGAVIWAQTRAPLADVAALRETSVISAALIGTIWLRERFGTRRVAAAFLVAVGIVLISA